jgi:hypothetical protein
MATPLVSGAWTILQSLTGSTNVTYLLEVFQKSGVSILDSRNGVTKTRIDLLGAMTYAGCGNAEVSGTEEGKRRR